MRITHVLTGFDVDFAGGITNYVRTLSKDQVAQGHAVTVIDGSGTNRLHPDGYAVRPFHGTIRPFVASMRNDPMGTATLLALLKETAADIVHFHLTVGVGTDFYEQFAGLGVPYVVSLHDYYLICPRITLIDHRGRSCSGPSEAKCRRCVGRLEQVDLMYKAARRTGLRLPRIPSDRVNARNASHASFLEQAHAVLPVSNRVSELAQALAPDSNFQVCHIGSASATTPRPDRTPSHKLRVRFIGVLSHHKGAEILIELANTVRRDDVEFHVHGRYESPWDRRARSAGIELHGPYTPDQLPGIMASTDLGAALPVWEDNGPQVVMEFINLGVPVLATRMGGIPDFVNDSTGFLFNPDEAGLRSAVEYIEQLDVSELRDFATRMPRLLTPRAHADSVLSVYTNAVAGRSARPESAGGE